ncbi:MAG: Rne/Rng family ribonuclease [Gammaproteobacteria bacterium]|nr:MAG: Rne/Rng family ribonuclease [Gammaproteobacteria bacterium]
MKRMLINATQPEELRVALVDGQRLYDLDIETPSREKKKSNIYKARVVRIEPSLEAAFVDYGAARHGFLPFKEISRSLFKQQEGDGGQGRVNLKEELQPGQEFIVQIEKEERGNKGAALTTSISLAGRYLVLMPNNPRAGGVSRQIEGTDRSDAREAMSVLEIPQGMGLILRTAGIGKNSDELQWDLDYLLHLWEAISTAAKGRPAPFLIHQESDLVIRAIRDYLRNDISEIWVDDAEVYDRARDFMQQVMPANLNKLKLYAENDPLFNRYQIEGQIETAFSRKVNLPSGGAVIIDHTEALTSIDINSARATAGGDIEETAYNTNLEAADEVTRQMRLRDLGGLIVIDFIDMTNSRHQRDVENRLKDALKIDRARVQVGRISRFGLLEMSRQRLRPSLGESSHVPCPRCEGQGTIRGIESLSLAVLRLIEEEAMKDSTAKIIARLPIDTATFLLNEKRQGIREIETRLDVEVIIVPDPKIESPHYQVQRVRLSEVEAMTQNKASYALPRQTEESGSDERRTVTTPRRVEEPAVKQILPEKHVPAPAPVPAPRKKSLIARIFGSFFGLETEEPRPPARPQQAIAKRPPQTATPPAAPQPQSESTRPGGGRNRPRPQRQQQSARSGGEQTGNVAEGGTGAVGSEGRGRRKKSQGNRQGGRSPGESSGQPRENRNSDRQRNRQEPRQGDSQGRQDNPEGRSRHSGHQRNRNRNPAQPEKQREDAAQGSGESADRPVANLTGSADTADSNRTSTVPAPVAEGGSPATQASDTPVARTGADEITIPAHSRQPEAREERLEREDNTITQVNPRYVAEPVWQPAPQANKTEPAAPAGQENHTQPTESPKE